MMFIDFTVIQCDAGNGGPGLISFRREKFVPKGGPNGGDGGRGGNIILKVDPNLHTLHDIRYNRLYKAQNGQPGGSNNKTGRNGEDIIIRVPQGTLVRNQDTAEIVADLVKPGESFILCEGGKGGKGNTHFRTAQHQTPRYAQPGLPGESGHYELELKVLADVGLVGFPNAGKSTLLSVISAAKPKIADYPFTTLVPNLGIVKYGDYKSFVIADIPGLIEGASEGKGLGHQFLRHVERNHILLFLIDGNESDPEHTFHLLLQELKKYDPVLLDKPRLVLQTKSDTLNEESRHHWQDVSFAYITISSVTGQGIPQAIQKIGDLLDALR